MAMERSTWAAMNHRFTVTTSRPELNDWLDAVLMDLRVDVAPERHYRLDLAADGSWTASLDGEPLGSSQNVAHALGLLLWRINRGAIEDTLDLLLLHAGGVTVHGRGVILAGAMEAGKSTLTAGLLRAGCGYLSDEIVGVDHTIRLRAYPKAVSLDPGSWALFPDLEQRLSHSVTGMLPLQWQVPASTAWSVSLADNVEPAAVVLPKHCPGSALELRRIGGPEALLRLLHCTFSTCLKRRTLVARLSELLNLVPAYELVFDDLDGAVGAVLDVAVAQDDPVEAVLPEAAVPTGRPGRSRGPSAVAPDMTLDDKVFVQPTDGATLLDVGAGHVVYDAAVDSLHELDALGAALWREMESGVVLADLIDRLSAAPDVDRGEVARSVFSFVAELHGSGVLEVRSEIE